MKRLSKEQIMRLRFKYLVEKSYIQRYKQKVHASGMV